MNERNSIGADEMDRMHDEGIAINEEIKGGRLTTLEASVIDDLKKAESLPKKQIPLAIMNSLSQDPFIAEQYRADSGVDKEITIGDRKMREKYTIGQHTAAVMTQFEKYFADKLPEGIDSRFFRRILALHDIGKPAAIAEGDKHRQHEFTDVYVQNILTQLGEDEKHIQLARALLNSDVLGRYLKKGDLGEAVETFEKIFKDSGVPEEVAFQLMLIFFQVDAGSYCADATVEGIVEILPSLDYLFDFKPEEGKMDFSEEIRPKIAKLKDALGL